MTAPSTIPIRDNERCERLVSAMNSGVLVLCDAGEPYAVPMNHSFRDGTLYFHCATAGRKLDFLRKNPRVVYVVSRHFGPPENLGTRADCHGKWESLILHGTARIPTDPAEAKEAFARFMEGQGRPGFEATPEILEETRAIVVTVERMTLRREPERKRPEFFEWVPPEGRGETR